ncbi:MULTISPECIES: MarR family transcriptional regulator [unclassified Pseudodesulfovibrio]|uniref:MarR family winged helix-turn-helix transcriptional regulator n=1 Tax=unclassified Pseudodesulfovibrio TaxID=2661612 RepID=UPI000FEBEDD3|nr:MULTISPECIES: MarR family transcriptional regulator [unclassified Pseudodesulfovibrio]MCJ2164308.1 MarR family transcriptional regulator [Pseudodesulfovibrio sp. S3-i]RWU04519.1 MarR family transcriptional regulator [Pseudodesulfovibrio sp. S3]
MAGKHASGAQLHALFKELFHTQATLSVLMDDIHEQAGMRTSQVRLANTLVKLGRTTVPDVAHALNISRQFVQTAVNELEQQNMIVFLDNPRHKRSKLLELTDHGRETLRQVHKNEAAIIQQMLPDIDATSAVNACTLLECVREKMALLIPARGA